jgi:hypothetical protein
MYRACHALIISDIMINLKSKTDSANNDPMRAILEQTARAMEEN